MGIDKHTLSQVSNIRLAFLLLLSLVMTTLTASAEITHDESQILANISTERMMKTIDLLCSDELAGRRAGTPGADKARDYLISQYRDAGLSPLPNNAGYTQPLTMRYSLVKSKSDIKATLSYNRNEIKGDPTVVRSFDYPTYNGRGGLDIKSRVVFVGYGIYNPSDGYDDYSGIDVTGKIVIWLPGQPAGANNKTKATGAQKMLAAYQHGASACIMYKPAGMKDEWGTNTGFAGAISDFPYIAVDDKIASELMAPSKLNMKTLLKKPASNLPIGAKGVELQLRVNPVCDPNRPAYNVLATIAGTDSAVSDEVILVGAHYDHIGNNGVAAIFRGADDNASGTSVVLETARVIRQSGLAPKRTIVFCAWTGEECGLVGSNYFAENSPFPIKKIVSNFELDMVGTGTPGSICTTGASAYPAHYKYLSGSALDLNLTLKADTVIGASDHLAFTRKHVPSSLIYADGVHPNYHTVKDVPSGIDRNVLESIAKFTALSVWRSANS